MVKYRVKKRWPAAGIVLILCLGAAIVWKCFNEADHIGYTQVLQRANPSLSLDSDKPYHASQGRVGVQKEFWLLKDGKRLAALLTCSEAQLLYEKDGEGQSFVESMTEVKGSMQEDLFYQTESGENVPWQRVRWVEAGTAKYHYTNGALEAQDVSMKLFNVPGHILPADFTALRPAMEGKADTLSYDTPRIYLKNKVRISIEGVGKVACDRAQYDSGTLILRGDVRVDFPEYGTLKSQEEILVKTDRAGLEGVQSITCLGGCEYQCDNEERNLDLILVGPGDVYLDRGNRKVTLSGKKNAELQGEAAGQVYFRDHLGKIYADDAVVEYEEAQSKVKPAIITLTGNVSLINREGALLQYALADRVVYDYPLREMQLFGYEKKRVLFYDKINNLQVSAPQMKIHRDKKTRKEHFQGIGDVRFNFAEKEFEQIRKRFITER